jgi:hypothetical protein
VGSILLSEKDVGVQLEMLDTGGRCDVGWLRTALSADE